MENVENNSVIIKQIDDVLYRLNTNLNMSLILRKPNEQKARFFTSKTAPVRIIIWLRDFFEYNSGTISVFVEPFEKGVEHLDSINQINFTDDEKILIDENTSVRKSYLHYATLRLEPSQEDLNDLTNYVYQQITQTPIKDIFIKIETLLSKKAKR